MIWASTRDGVVTYAGPEWTTFTGQSSDAAVGNGWLEMLHPEDRDRTHTFFKAACASMSAFTVRYRLYHVTDGYKSVVSGAVPSISPVDQTFIGFLGNINVIDIHSNIADIMGTAIIEPPSKSTIPQTPVDLIADYLLLARAVAEQAGEQRLLASLDFAVSEVMRRLGYGTAANTAN